MSSAGNSYGDLFRVLQLVAVLTPVVAVAAAFCMSQAFAGYAGDVDREAVRREILKRALAMKPSEIDSLSWVHMNDSENVYR
jgi:hypothetical protein